MARGDPLRCLPITATTDGPLFTAKPGTLSGCVNMTVQPGGYVEARGGTAELKPSGGTAVAWITAGGFCGVHEVSSSTGTVLAYNASSTAWTGNFQFHAGGWNPFPTGIVDDACYWMADAPFSRICVALCAAAAYAAITITYKYWNGSTWAALTTNETIDWTDTTGPLYASWTLPSDWAPTTIGAASTGFYYGYAVQVAISSVTTLTAVPGVAYTVGYWIGTRRLFVTTHNPLNGSANGGLLRYGQNGTTGTKFAVTAGLHTGATQPARMVSYRGRLFAANGSDLKTYDDFSLRDAGLATGTWTASASAGTGTLPNGTYWYYAAWGYGRVTADYSATQPYDYQPQYGWGQATYLDTITIAASPQGTDIDFTGTSVPDNVGAIAVYRTQDLTNVETSKRGFMPAQMIFSLRRLKYTTTFSDCFGSATLTDDGGAPIWPPVEAYLSDIQPPKGGKFLVVHQNRLLIGNDETWYWSDPFVPERFRKEVSYISLAKSTGGRHTGGADYGDQAVLFTEDQTWGLTNIDLDIPNLYPIHPGVGCIAPDSVAVGDGLILWAARDGIYGWDGSQSGPRKLSWDWNETFGKLSFENHGGSRAIIHNYQYDIRLSNPDYTTVGGLYRLNLLTMQWSTITHAGFTDDMFPFGPIHGELGGLDPGYLHPIYGKGNYASGTDYGLYYGEQTTQDIGSNYTCSATAHFPLPPGALFNPRGVFAYYLATDGWGTPALSYTPATYIGDTPGAITTGTPDTGEDYSVVKGSFAQTGLGTSDLQVKFSVASAASGTVAKQRLFGMILFGRVARDRAET